MVQPRAEDGFTLIEVLIVVVVIGLLAALALASFLSQTDKARGASAKSGLHNAELALQSYETAHATFAATTADLLKEDPTLAEARNLTVSGTKETWSLSVDSAASPPVTFTVSRDATGALSRTCTVDPRECPEGTW